MKKIQMKDQRGITLLALVVTIVVLLILASVSIAMLGGENGIIKQAQKANEETEIGEEKDFINLAVSAIKTDKISRGDTSEITSDELQNEINNYTNKATVSGEGILIVTYTSGRDYEVDGSGNLIIPEQSYDGMYSEAGLEGKISPSDLFEYEKIDDKTARILRIKPEYCNIEGYNPHTDEIDLENTEGYIKYKGEYIEDLLVLPYEVILEDGKTYKITEASLYAKGPIIHGCGVDENQYQYPNIEKIIFSNTIENLNGIDIGLEGSPNRLGPFILESVVSEIVLPNNLKKIGDLAFYTCRNLTNIKIPNSVTSIGKWAFGVCTELASINIPNGVTSIGEEAFSGCIGLTSITIPGSVTDIGNCAFDWSPGLTTVYYTGTEEQWNQITIGYMNSYLENATIEYNHIVE